MNITQNNARRRRAVTQILNNQHETWQVNPIRSRSSPTRRYLVLMERKVFYNKILYLSVIRFVDTIY
jgi:hypothetical protein